MILYCTLLFIRFNKKINTKKRDGVLTLCPLFPHQKFSMFHNWVGLLMCCVPPLVVNLFWVCVLHHYPSIDTYSFANFSKYDIASSSSSDAAGALACIGSGADSDLN